MENTYNEKVNFYTFYLLGKHQYKCLILSILCVGGHESSVYEWTGDFQNETINFRMTSVFGHVMTLDFTGKYNNWDKVDPVSVYLF